MERTINHKGKKFALLSEEMLQALKNSNQNVEQTQSTEFAKVKKLDDKIQDILNDKTKTDHEKAQLYSMAAGNYINLRDRAPETIKTHYFNPIVLPPKKRETAPETQRFVFKPPPPQNQERETQTEQPSRHETETQTEKFTDEEEDSDAFTSPVASLADSPNEEPKTPLQRSFQEKLDKINDQEGPDFLNAKASNVRVNKALKIVDEIKKSPDHRKLTWDNRTKQMIINGQKMPYTNIEDILLYVANTTPSRKNFDPPHGTGIFLEALGKTGADLSVISNLTLRDLARGRSEYQYGTGKLPWTRL